MEARGEYVYVTFGNPANLRANNDSDPTNNVGKTMYGYSGELAYHLPLGNILNSEWELVPFYRYTYPEFPDRRICRNRSQRADRRRADAIPQRRHCLFPSPQIVLKATWQKVINNDPFGARSDSVLGGVGFFF